MCAFTMFDVSDSTAISRHSTVLVPAFNDAPNLRLSVYNINTLNQHCLLREVPEFIRDDLRCKNLTGRNDGSHLKGIITR